MHKPKLHVTPIKNWMNDPNGFIYFQNKYHLYYQHFPYEPQWGTMHWGHVVSDDLVHFEDAGIALYPSKSFDANGCWSGSAIEINNQMYIYYTGVYYDEFNKEDIHRTGNHVVQSQAMILSKDGYNLDISTKKQIIPSITDPKIGDFYDARDPKVFQIKDRYYIVLGTKHNGHGRALVYTSLDGENWKLLSINDDKRLGTMLECPDLYQINGQWIMTVSPMHKYGDGINYKNNCQYMLVDFDPETGKITFQSDPVLIDLGYDYYAAQSTADRDGNRVIIGWMRMVAPVDGYNGLFTFPRIIDYKNGHVYYSVHPNVKKCFKEDVTAIDDISPYYFSIDCANGSEISIAGFKIKIENDQVITDRTEVHGKKENALGHLFSVGVRFETPAINGKIHLDIYLDYHIIEIYINDGYYVLSNVIYNQTSEYSIQNAELLELKKGI